MHWHWYVHQSVSASGRSRRMCVCSCVCVWGGGGVSASTGWGRRRVHARPVAKVKAKEKKLRLLCWHADDGNSDGSGTTFTSVQWIFTLLCFFRRFQIPVHDLSAWINNATVLLANTLQKKQKNTVELQQNIKNRPALLGSIGLYRKLRERRSLKM